MMLRTANLGSDGITTNGFLPTRETNSTNLSVKYSDDHRSDQDTAKGMHPKLSSYFMDLDEFCSAANPKEKNGNINVPQTSPNVTDLKRSTLTDKDPAGLFPTNTSSGQSRLFMPKILKVDQPSTLNSPLSPTNGINYTSPMDGTRQRPGTPPALVSATHTATTPYSSQQQQGIAESAATMVSLYQQHTVNQTSPSSQSSPSGASSFISGNSRDGISDSQMDDNVSKKRAKRKPREYVYNPKPFKQKAPASSRLTAPKDETYWDKRIKNNVAAKRSRENRRRKEIETVDKCTILEHENAELRERISTLEKQNAWLEGKLTKFLLP